MQGKDCAELIKRIHCAIKKNADNELREEDLTFAQVHLLFILSLFQQKLGIVSHHGRTGQTLGRKRVCGIH